MEGVLTDRLKPVV